MVALVGVLVGMAPTLVSWGLGDGLVRGAIEKRINGTVVFARLKLAWFGDQSVEDLVITDLRGVKALEVDASVGAGLLRLLAGGEGPIEVEVSGIARADLLRDGSTSFGDLPAGAGRAAGEPFRLDLPPTTVRVKGLRVELTDEASGELIVLDELRGELALVPGGRTVVDLASPTTSAGRRGSLTARATIEGLFDEHGALALARASGSAELELANVLVPRAERPTVITAASLQARSADLTDQMTLSVTMTLSVRAGAGSYDEPGRLEGRIVVSRPVGADGRVQLGVDRLSGELTGRAVPTALAQPFFAGRRLMLGRDVGPTVDLDATFSSGDDGRMSIRAKAKHLELALEGTVEPERRALKLSRLDLRADVAPELVASLRDDSLSFSKRARLVAEVTEFTVPPTDGPRPAWRQATLAGTLLLLHPVGLVGAEGRALANLETFQLAFGSRGLSEELNLDGRAMVDGAVTTFSVRSGGLFGPEGTIVLAPGRVRLEVRGLRRATLKNLVPSQAALIDAALDDPLMLAVIATDEAGSVKADATLAAPGADVRLTAVYGAGKIEVTQARATLTIRPELVAVLQPDAAQPIRLERAAPVRFEAQRIDLGDWRPADGPFVASLACTVTAAELVFGAVPGLVEPVGLADLRARITARLAREPAWNVEGTARIQTAAGDRIAALEYDFGAEPGDEQPRAQRLHLKNLAVARLEPLAGYEPGTLTAWLGDQGHATIWMAQQPGSLAGTVRAEFPRLAGEFDLAMDDQALTITAHEPKLTVAREVLQRRLSAGGAPAPGAATPRVTVENDVPLDLQIRTLRLPRALIARGVIDPAATSIDLQLAAAPVAFTTTGYGKSTLERAVVTVRSDDLAGGISITMTGDVQPPDGARRGKIDVQGNVRGLVHDGALSPERAVLELHADGSRIPTALVDALGNFKGLLVAALGPELALAVQANGLSGTSGTLEGRIEGGTGWLEAFVRGAENALLVEPERPLRAELVITPALGQRLLSRIHPVLADIRSTEQPLKAVVTSARVPLDGNVKALDADLEITVGPVEFESGALTLFFLTVVQSSRGATIPGHVEPIRARIRKGVVTYERFAVRVHKITMVWSGQINLVTGHVNLRTEVPLQDLSLAIRELEDLGDVSVPIFLRGQLGNVKYEVDPEFIAEAALRGGLNRLLREGTKSTGVPLDGIFNDIFRKKKKKDDG